MKKLLTVSLLTASFSAFAGMPAGYVDVPESSNENQRVIANPEKGAVIAVNVVNQQTPALKVAQETVKDLNCPNVKVEGNDEMAGFDGCMVDGESISVMVLSSDGKTVIITGNDKATSEDVEEILK